MKNKIGIFLFIALLIAHQSISFAKEKKLYIPTKSVPLELRYLINTLQATKLKDSDSLKLDQQIHSLKKSLPLLATADIFTITKAEIYKSVISLSTDAGRSSAVNVFSIPEYISKLNALDTKRYGQFSAWLINSVKSDLSQILNNEEFQAYLQADKKNRQITTAMKTQRRKAEIIIPIYKQISTRTAAELDLLVQSKLLTSITRVTTFLNYMTLFTTERYQGKPRKFFETKTVQVSENSGTSIDKILAPVLNSDSNQGKQGKEWTPKDGMAIPKKKELYTPPKTLPTPVEDWQDDNEYILDLIVPNYTPPSSLPTPTNEWGEGEPEELPKAAPKPADPDEDWLIN